MAFPTTSINTTNLDSDGDSPLSARPDLYSAVVALNAIIASANGASGVPTLNGSGKLSESVLPNTITSTGTLNLNPTNGVVSVKQILRMNTYTVAEVNALIGTQPGDMVMVSDGDSGEITLAVYDGVYWRRIELMNPISDDSSIPPNFSN